MNKTKNPPNGVGSSHNKQHNESIVSRRNRLQKNLSHFVGIGELCEQFAIDLAKKAGVMHV